MDESTALIDYGQVIFLPPKPVGDPIGLTTITITEYHPVAI
jgi:hypothetical protein